MKVECPSVALFLVATGKYFQYTESWLRSAEKYFLPGRRVRVIVFTDHDCEGVLKSPSAEGGDPSSRVSISWVAQEALPWPQITLQRFEILLGAESIYGSCSHLFYLDADMRFEDVVGEEIISEGLVATIHPGFWNLPPDAYTYERRGESMACIPRGEGRKYYVGAFQGGSIGAFSAAMRVMAERTRADTERGVTAIWHDESHWNKYLVENPPAVALHPGYCFPESWSVPFPKKISALNKDHEAMRS